MPLQDQLRSYLQRLAEPVTYSRVMQDLGAPHMRNITAALEILMDEDAAQNRPFLSALVVSRTYPMPNRGFFLHARTLGRIVADEQSFHQAELAALGIPPRLP